MSDDDLHLFEVVIQDIDGGAATFLVASWRGPHKAVAMATLANESKARPVRLFKVTVDDLGRAPDSLPPEALVDRLEF